jgi:hypothetical protein
VISMEVSEVELACPPCGHCWWVDCREQRGRWLVADEDDAICPACGGTEGEAA